MPDMYEPGENDSQFRSAFEFSAVGMALATIHGRLFRVNDSLCHILGYERSKLLTCTFLDLTHPDDLRKDLNLLQELLDGHRENYQLEKRYLHADGHVVWALLAVSIVKDGEGKILHLIKQVQDITRFKAADEQLTQSENQFRAAFEFSAIGMALATTKGRLFKVNKSLSRMLGYSQQELLNHTFQDITHPEDLESDLHLLQGLLSGEADSYQMEKRYLHADGHTVWALLAVSAVRQQNGSIVHLIKQIQDISFIKEKEQNLKVLNQSVLENNDELLNKNEELRQFAYIASHDLKEPLRMVTGFLSKIERKYQAMLDEEGEQYIHYAVDGAIRMRRLIEDILAYSTIDNLAKAPKEEVDLNMLVKDIISFSKSVPGNEHAVITAMSMPVLISNSTLLYQLLANLVSNALKYQPPGNIPVVEIKVQDRITAWEFSVTDNGIGIDPAGIDKVFNIFQRLHSKEQYSGTGIGLAICKKIITMLKGHIWISSVPGEGSVFYFSLPKTNH